MTPNDRQGHLGSFGARSKILTCILHRPEVQIFVFRSPMSRFWATAHFSEMCKECALMNLTCSRLIIPTCMFHTPRGPNFCPLLSTTSGFWHTAQCSEKCTEWPQMTLTCSRSKTPTCMLQAPLWPKFPSVSLYDETISRKLRFLNSPLVTM